MQWTEWIFWMALGLAFYTYAGYGILVTLLNAFIRLSGPYTSFPPSEPTLTIIIPAYNEKAILDEKLANTFALLYPVQKKQVILITDGSNDGSDTYGETHPEVLHLHEDARKGKTAAINRAIPFATGEVIIITDANTMINAAALQQLVQHFSNPAMGGVSGEKRVVKEQGATSAGSESIYWKYESFLKKQGAEFYTIVGAAGEFFAFRKSLFIPMREDTILDDFILSMHIVKQGYRISYESKAFAEEAPSNSISDEYSRKVRISAGVFQSLGRLTFLFNPFFNIKAWFQFISHRFLRWTLGPLCLLLTYVFSGVLWDHHIFFRLFFSAGTFLIFLGLTGFILRNQKIAVPGFFIPFYFIMMNVAVVHGLLRYASGNQSVLWKKAAR